MKLHDEQAKLIKLQRKATKPRFQIEKLEERIAPKGCHYNPKGKLVGHCPCTRDC